MAWRHRFGVDLVVLGLGIEQEDGAIDVIEIDQRLPELVLQRVDAAGNLAAFLLQSGYGIGTFHSPLNHQCSGKARDPSGPLCAKMLH